jgi:hypothetical protein
MLSISWVPTAPKLGWRDRVAVGVRLDGVVGDDVLWNFITEGLLLVWRALGLLNGAEGAQVSWPVAV